MNNKWVFVENKSEIIKDAINNIIDGKDESELELRIINLDGYEIDDISAFELDDLRKLIINESIKIFYKVIDTD